MFSVIEAPPSRPSLIAPLNKYSCQYEHPSKNLSYAPEIGRKIRIFSLAQENNILIYKKECIPPTAQKIKNIDKSEFWE